MKEFNNEKILFRERQQFRQGWLWFLLVFSTITSVLLPTVLMFNEGKVKDGLFAVGLVLFMGAVNMLLFYITSFETVVTVKGIYYRWMPFFRNYSFIDIQAIADIKLQKWTNTSWGYSKTKKWGKAHTVSGDRGVAIDMKDGRKYYIGSQQALSLLTSCEQLMLNPFKHAR
ncbi:hypothetical protein [Foetidibacter luteolus]|uniref:hypothetical protein n=1 Tax=Foetidibacter luteolus TaxID=2608880 RepID=UPI00129A7D36|nr:hypothetical protein [Foetidibacter luteolus]